MPIINPDLSDVGPITPGTYPATINKVDVGTSKAGNPKIVPEFAIVVEAGKEPRTRQAHLNISGPGASGFARLLRACGFREEAAIYEDPNAPNPPFDTDKLVGSELLVVVEENLYQGEKRDQISGYLPR